MSKLQKTQEFEEDLIEIWNYTAEKWGEAQADLYLHKVEASIKAISQGEALMKHFTKNVYVLRCEHHYIFVLIEKMPMAIAIFHEKMDFLTRLKKRLK